MPVINLPTGQPTYQGEVLLLGWSENNRDGMTVRLALDASDEGAVHPFRHLGTGKHGQRFMAVLVPVSDEPVSENRPETETGSRTPTGRKWDDMTYAQQAGIACGEPDFWTFLGEKHGLICHTPDGAANAVRLICKVKFRAELDTDETAAERWRTLYGEYKRWRAGQREAEEQVREYGR